ncbi:hypothetical protein P7C70_g6361, partial [Phenoliferia sp. Uapishka_3]
TSYRSTFVHAPPSPTPSPRASSALAQAGLGLLALPLSDRQDNQRRSGESEGLASDQAQAWGEKTMLSMASHALLQPHHPPPSSPKAQIPNQLSQSLSSKPASRKVSFSNDSAPVRPPVATLGGTQQPAVFTNASSSTAVPVEPSPRKTSGPRALLRRARSFGTMGNSSKVVPVVHVAAPSTSQLPPSPPLPSPPLPRHGSAQPPPSPSSTARPFTVKGKERAATLYSDYPSSSVQPPPWLASPQPSSSPILGLPRDHPQPRVTDPERKSNSAILKRRSFSLWRRNDSTPTTTAASSPVLNPLDVFGTPATSFDPTSNDNPFSLPSTSESASLPSLPSLQLSSPYRMSWAFSHTTPPPPNSANSTTTSSSIPSPRKLSSFGNDILRTSTSRPHSSSGPPGGGGWVNRPEGLVDSPAEEKREEAVGLGFELTSGGNIKRRSTLTRLVRSNSDVARRTASSTPPLATLPRTRSGSLLNSVNNGRSSSPSPARPPSPLKSSTGPVASPIPLSSPSFPFSSSPERAISARSNLPRRPTTAGSTNSALSVITGFFSGSGTSLSNSNAGSAMSRSSSSNSTSNTGGGIQANEFGALFDGNGGGKSAARKRGMSVGDRLFSNSTTGRKRAESSSSLSNSWVPPGPTVASLMVPSGELGGGFSTPGSTAGTSSPATGRSRASTDPRRFSFSSNASASSQSSVLPIHSPGLFPPTIYQHNGASVPTPPASPPATRRSSSLAPAPVQGRPRAASVKVCDGESPVSYVNRLMGEVRKSEVARLLASHSDPFHTSALAYYFSSFDFSSLPLDIALRKFLMEAALPTETQQIDRVMEAFAVRYTSSNSGLFVSSDTPYVLAFSLVMLSTDQFNPSNKNKMTKADYVRNTKVEGVSTEVLEYFFDQITITPFIFVEDEADSTGLSVMRPELSTSGSGSFFGLNSTAQKERAKLDPYHLIAQNRTHELRVDVAAVVPEKSPISFTGTTSFFNATTLHRAFARAPVLQVTSARPRSRSTAGEGAPLAPVSSISTFKPPSERGAISSLKITKIGLLSRKEDLVEGGRKSSSRKWKGWSVILTGSQLLFFKDPGVAFSLQQSIEAASMAVAPAPSEDSVLVFSTSMGFKPDAVLSLAHSAAIYDSTYAKYEHVFRLVAPAGRQYLFQARDADDLNSWLAHINYAATFKSAGIRMRSAKRSEPSSSSSPAPPATTMPPVLEPRTSIGSLDGTDPQEPLDPDVTIHALSPVTEEDPALRESLQTARIDATPLGRLSAEFPFPPYVPPTATPEPSTSTPSSPLIGSERDPDTRAEILRTIIAELETKIRTVKGELHADLRLARNLAVLTPFMRSTRERIQASIGPIEKRVRHTRMDLAKLVCHREVLTRELLVEDRESQRTRKVSRGRLASGPFNGSNGWPPVAGSRVTSSTFTDVDDGFRDSFESTADPYVGALTDDELDRIKSPPMMHRSLTQTDEVQRLRSGTITSEDELPSRDMAKGSTADSRSSLGRSLLHGKHTPSVASFTDHAPSEVGSVDDSLSPSPVDASLSTLVDEEEAEDWRQTRGAKHVSIIDYDALALATLREVTTNEEALSRE